MFQLPSGPPWIHNTSGAGASPSGSVNHDRIGVPSDAVAITSVTSPGIEGISTHGNAVTVPSGSMRTGCWGAA